MNQQDIHQRARRLVADQAIEGLRSDDNAWLEQHLEGCRDCAAYTASASRAVQALRLASVTADPALVQATRRSVRIYAERLRENESRQRLLVISCILAAIWGAALQPYLWRGFHWLGTVLNLPDLAWQAAFLMFWLLPGVIVALIFICHPRTAHLRRSVGA